MAATGLNINWTAVSYNSTPIKRVTNVAINDSPQILPFAGDTDRYPTVLADVGGGVTITVTTGDAGTAFSLASGTAAAFTATHKDAKGAEGGDIIYTMSAMVGNRTAGGQHAQFGQATVEFTGVSIDGLTNPLSFTRA